jgi:hypothetical protein
MVLVVTAWSRHRQVVGACLHCIVPISEEWGILAEALKRFDEASIVALRVIVILNQRLATTSSG